MLSAKGRRGSGSLVECCGSGVGLLSVLTRHDGQPAGLLVERVEVDKGVKAVGERPEGG